MSKNLIHLPSANRTCAALLFTTSCTSIRQCSHYLQNHCIPSQFGGCQSQRTSVGIVCSCNHHVPDQHPTCPHRSTQGHTLWETQSCKNNGWSFAVSCEDSLHGSLLRSRYGMAGSIFAKPSSWELEGLVAVSIL